MVSTTLTPVERMTTQEKLLLAQAVYKLGAVAWPEDIFTTEAIETAYVELMTGIGIMVPAQDGMKPQAKVHLRLARTFYLARMGELKESIANYEQRFTTLMSEIQQIKSGELDASIQAELRGVLARKYGKKLLDSWVPPPEDVKEAVENRPAVGLETQDVEVKAASPPHEAKEIEAVAAVEKPQSSPVKPTTPRRSRPSSPDPSELSPPPSVPIDDVPPPATADSPATEAPSSSRANKRRASGQPKGAPVSKRSGKRGVSTALTVADSEPEKKEPQVEAPSSLRRRKSARGVTKEMEEENEAEVEKEEQEDADETLLPPTTRRGRPATKKKDARKEVEDRSEDDDVNTHEEDKEEKGPSSRSRRKSTRGGRKELEKTAELEEEEEEDKIEEAEETTGRGRRGRLSVARSKRAQESPSTSGPAKDISSPAASRRAPSVSSTASVAPTSTRRNRRGMRDEVVSKSVREQSAATSVKEEQQEDDEEEEEEHVTRRSGRRGIKAEPSTPATEKEREKEKETSKKGKRDSLKPPHADDAEERDASVTPQPNAVPGRMSRTGRQSSPRDVKGVQKLILSLLEAILVHRYANLFQGPVKKKSDAPGYYEIIKRPIDLKTIRQRIRDGQISSIDEFERDISLLFANAMMYNAVDSHFYDMAKEMKGDAENHIAHYRSLQHDIGR